MIERRGFQFNTQSTILTILGLVLFIMALGWLIRGIFTILAIIAPILLIITVIIDHRIVLNYGKWLLKLLKNNTVVGVLATLLTIAGFPVVCFLLFGRAMLQRKVKQLENEYRAERDGSYTEYEVIEDEVQELPLPPLEKESPLDKTSDYERLFD